MKILISPAKNMNTSHDFLKPKSLPFFLAKTKEIVEVLKNKSYDDYFAIFNASQNIINKTYQTYQNFSFTENLTPAILAYDGIQYKYMLNTLFTSQEYEYLNENLYILSGLYGVLRPFDGISDYRLEMVNNLAINENKDLYQYWHDLIYQYIFKDNEVVLSLLSNEYKKCLLPYLKNNDQFIEVYFYEKEGNKLKDKAVYTKMARGLMVRYIVQNKIKSLEEVKKFQENGYEYNEELSNNYKLVFIRTKI